MKQPARLRVKEEVLYFWYKTLLSKVQGNMCVYGEPGLAAETIYFYGPVCPYKEAGGLDLHGIINRAQTTPRTAHVISRDHPFL